MSINCKQAKSIALSFVLGAAVTAPVVWLVTPKLSAPANPVSVETIETPKYNEVELATLMLSIDELTTKVVYVSNQLNNLMDSKVNPSTPARPASAEQAINDLFQNIDVINAKAEMDSQSTTISQVAESASDIQNVDTQIEELDNAESANEKAE